MFSIVILISEYVFKNNIDNFCKIRRISNTFRPRHTVYRRSPVHSNFLSRFIKVDITSWTLRKDYFITLQTRICILCWWDPFHLNDTFHKYLKLT